MTTIEAVKLHREAQYDFAAWSIDHAREVARHPEFASALGGRAETLTAYLDRLVPACLDDSTSSPTLTLPSDVDAIPVVAVDQYAKFDVVSPSGTRRRTRTQLGLISQWVTHASYTHPDFTIPDGFFRNLYTDSERTAPYEFEYQVASTAALSDRNERVKYLGRSFVVLGFREDERAASPIVTLHEVQHVVDNEQFPIRSPYSAIDEPHRVLRERRGYYISQRVLNLLEVYPELDTAPATPYLLRNTREVATLGTEWPSLDEDNPNVDHYLDTVSDDAFRALTGRERAA